MSAKHGELTPRSVYPWSGWGRFAVAVGIVWVGWADLGADVVLDLPANAIDLGQESALAQQITPGQKDHYVLSLEANEFAVVEVEQKGVDVEVILLNPGDLGVEVALPFDTPTGGFGTERVLLLSRERKTFRLTVSLFEGEPAGTYFLRVVDRHPARGRDVIRTKAHTDDARIGVMAGPKKSEQTWKAAARLGTATLALWDQADDPGGRLQTLEKLGQLHRERLGDDTAAEKYFLDGLALAVRLEDRYAEGRFSNNMGALLDLTTRSGEKQAWYQRALEVGEQLAEEGLLGGDAVAGTALSNLAKIYRKNGDLYQSLNAYYRSLLHWRCTDSRKSELNELQAMGRLYLRLREPKHALAIEIEALALAESLGDTVQGFVARRRIGQAQLLLGEFSAAQISLEEALALPAAGSRGGRANALFLLGEAHRRQGNLEMAEELLHQALDQYGDHPLGVGLVLPHLARVKEDQGDPEDALRVARSAIEALGRESPASYRATARWVLARALRLVGDSGGALREINVALALVEGERKDVPDALGRAEIIAFRYDYFLFAVDLLLKMDRERPNQGFRRQALEVVERSRARSLRESFGGIGSNSKDDGAQIKALQADADTLWERIRQLGLGRSEGQLPAGLEALEWLELRERHRLLVAELGLRRARAFRSQTRPPATVAAVQAVLESETRLLSFSLGEQASWLWVVGPTTLEVYPLPERAAIETTVHQLVASLRQNHRPLSAERLLPSLSNLAESLLGDAMAELIGVRRLVVVGEGALHYLPFGVLPNPRSDRSRFLVEDFEIVRLPSASFLVDLATKHKPWRPEGVSAVIFSDAVYGSDDEYFQPEIDPGQRGLLAGGPRAVEATEGLEPLERLRFSADEAAAIRSYLPGKRSKVFDRFEARRDVLLSTDLSSFDIVHLIAHGEIDTEYPELSRLVFSRLDREGNPVDGNLRAHEVYGLKLNAGLVVLSSCETALGRAVRGEGLVGLTQGFFATGAPRVVVSLWKVNDAATAELMKALYRYMFKEGWPPARALRQAQLELLQRGHPPNHWAPFVLVGDRN